MNVRRVCYRDQVCLLVLGLDTASRPPVSVACEYKERSGGDEVEFAGGLGVAFVGERKWDDPFAGERWAAGVRACDVPREEPSVARS